MWYQPVQIHNALMHSKIKVRPAYSLMPSDEHVTGGGGFHGIGVLQQRIGGHGTGKPVTGRIHSF